MPAISLKPCQARARGVQTNMSRELDASSWGVALITLLDPKYFFFAFLGSEQSCNLLRPFSQNNVRKHQRSHFLSKSSRRIFCLKIKEKGEIKEPRDARLLLRRGIGPVPNQLEASCLSFTCFSCCQQFSLSLLTLGFPLLLFLVVVSNFHFPLFQAAQAFMTIQGIISASCTKTSNQSFISVFSVWSQSGTNMSALACFVDKSGKKWKAEKQTETTFSQGEDRAEVMGARRNV